MTIDALGGADLQAALAYISDLKEQIERQVATAPANRPKTAMSLRGLCELYFQHNPRKVSDATIARARINASNVCRLMPSEFRPDEIDEPAVIHYRNAREAEGARPRTILGEMSFLKMVLQFGMSWRRLTGMQTVSFLTVPDVGEWDHPGVALSIDEFREVLSVLSPINRRRFIWLSNVYHQVSSKGHRSRQRATSFPPVSLLTSLLSPAYSPRGPGQ